MTAISDSYINNTTTKVMRVGDKLYSPIILPPSSQQRENPAVAKFFSGINPLMTVSESACILEEQQRQQVNLEQNCEPFVIEATSGRLAVVCSPYSPMMDDASVTLHEPFDNDHASALCRDPSFHAVLPSLAISRSAAMFDERLFDGLSFNGSFSGATTQPSDTHDGSLVKSLCRPSNDVPWKKYVTFKEDEPSNMEVQDEENEFSMVSKPEEKNRTKPVKRKSNVGNILKKRRKNYDARQTNILMDWYLQNDGKTPSSQGKLDLVKATNLNLVQSK